MLVYLAKGDERLLGVLRRTDTGFEIRATEAKKGEAPAADSMPLLGESTSFDEMCNTLIEFVKEKEREEWKGANPGPAIRNVYLSADGLARQFRFETKDDGYTVAMLGEVARQLSAVCSAHPALGCAAQLHTCDRGAYIAFGEVDDSGRFTRSNVALFGHMPDEVYSEMTRVLRERFDDGKFETNFLNGKGRAKGLIECGSAGSEVLLRVLVQSLRMQGRSIDLFDADDKPLREPLTAQGSGTPAVAYLYAIKDVCGELGLVFVPANRHIGSLSF